MPHSILSATLIVAFLAVVSAYKIHWHAINPSFVSHRTRLCDTPNGLNVQSTPLSVTDQLQSNIARNLRKAAVLTTVGLLFDCKTSRADEALASGVLSRADVGFIDLNSSEPMITDVCWMNVKVGDADPQRIEISLYGNVVPKTTANFKALCKGDAGFGYKGSDFFRVISTFSVQGGNIGQPADALQSQLCKFGKAASGEPFPAENYRILHSYESAGVISMMKDLMNKGQQDSRFFITTSPFAAWADEKYVAFGRVTKGMQLIQAMQIVPVKTPTNYPLTRIQIVDAGCY